MELDSPWTRLSAHGLCVVDDRVLLVRFSEETRDPGSWGLPGGRLDWGEHPADGLRRELREETGLVGEVGEVVGVFSAVYRRSEERPFDSCHVVSVLYRVDGLRGDLVHEVGGTTDRAEWVAMADVRRRPLVPLADHGLSLVGL